MFQLQLCRVLDMDFHYQDTREAIGFGKAD
jgi:hypothetical protein